MKKIKLVGLLFAALCAFSAVAATAAFAETEFLVDGASIPAGTEIAVLSETISLLLEDMKGGLFGEGVDVLCSGTNEGTVGTNLVLINKIFDLSGKELPPGFVSCTTDAGICPEPEAQPVNLPWHAELDLALGSPVRALLLEEKLSGWTLLCSKGSVEDKCTAEAGVDTSVGLDNTTENDILVLFDAATAPGSCTRGGVKQGLVEGEILFFVHEKTLSVDE